MRDRDEISDSGPRHTGNASNVMRPYKFERGLRRLNQLKLRAGRWLREHWYEQ